jgi:transcriptional regulator with XRE-family HTH domain
MSFGGYLRTLRGEAILSRAELGRRAGVPASTLRHWENGRGFPAAPAFLRLAEAVGVPAERPAEGADDLAEEVAGTAETERRRTRQLSSS